MSYIQFLNMIVEHVGMIIQYIGIFIVVESVFRSLWRLIDRERTMEHIRHHMAKQILFGLEFVIAADVLLATVVTDQSQLLQLGGIVLIRVVLGYSLEREAGLIK